MRADAVLAAHALTRVRVLFRYVSAEEGVTHLITFADNNAVGYFQKQARRRSGRSARGAARSPVLNFAPFAHVLTSALPLSLPLLAGVLEGDPDGAREVGWLHQGTRSLLRHTRLRLALHGHTSA
jgi:hypothetical protein